MGYSSLEEVLRGTATITPMKFSVFSELRLGQQQPQKEQ
jgi:hypothetical protein